jgi:hypothetical protein
LKFICFFCYYDFPVSGALFGIRLSSSDYDPTLAGIIYTLIAMRSLSCYCLPFLFIFYFYFEDKDISVTSARVESSDIAMNSGNAAYFAPATTATSSVPASENVESHPTKGVMQVSGSAMATEAISSAESCNVLQSTPGCIYLIEMRTFDGFYPLRHLLFSCTAAESYC